MPEPLACTVVAHASIGRARLQRLSTGGGDPCRSRELPAKPRRCETNCRRPLAEPVVFRATRACPGHRNYARRRGLNCRWFDRKGPSAVSRRDGGYGWRRGLGREGPPICGRRDRRHDRRRSNRRGRLNVLAGVHIAAAVAADARGSRANRVGSLSEPVILPGTNSTRSQRPHNQRHQK
jgi:hypothetical protein